MGKAYFLTFGGGGSWPAASRRVGEQARRTGLFTDVICVTSTTLFRYCPELKPHHEYLKLHPRGFGYWAWKPFLIRKTLEYMQEGDVLLYLDAGFEILQGNRDRIAELIHAATQKNIVAFDYSKWPIFNCVFWTKQDLIDYFRTSRGTSVSLNVPLISGGSLFFRKCSASCQLVDDWATLSVLNGYHYGTDAPSTAQPEHRFFEHRHDQSQLSLLFDAHGFTPHSSAFDYDYKTDWILKHPHTYAHVQKQPFLASRNSKPTSELEKLDVAFANWQPDMATPHTIFGETETVAMKLHLEHYDELLQLADKGLLSQTRTIDERSIESYLCQAQQCRHEHRFRDAVTLLENAHRKYPNNADIIAALAMVAIDIGNRDSTLRLLGELDRLAPHYPERDKLVHGLSALAPGIKPSLDSDDRP